MITPTIEQITSFLEEYGWKYRKTTSELGGEVVVSNYQLLNSTKGILFSFNVEGEFVMASTLGLLNKIPKDFASRFLSMNDTIKLIKVFSVSPSGSDVFDVEMGFELWGESWNKDTFYAFLDMLCLGIEKVFEIVAVEKIPHETKYITYQ